MPATPNNSIDTGAPYRVPPEPKRWPSIGLAVGVHALLLAFLVIGVSWQNNQPVAVEAEVWDVKTETAALPPPTPQPEPEPEPEPATPPPQPAPKVATVPPPPPPPQVEQPAVKQPKAPDIALERKKKDAERKRVAAERAAQEEREEREREQAEKAEQAKQKRIADQKAAAQAEKKEREAEKKAAAEAQAKKDAAAEKKAAAEAQAKKDAQEAKEAAAAEAKAKKDAEQKKKDEAEKKKKDDAAKKEKAAKEQAKLDAARADEMRRITGAANSVTGNGTSGTAEKSSAPKRDAGYIAAITAAVKSHSAYGGDDPGNPVVSFHVEQLPTGEILSVKKTKSSGVPAFDDAIERAIKGASPLPKKKDGTVERSLEINFKMKDMQ